MCSQAMPTVVGGWDIEMSGERKVEGEGLCDPLGMGAERKGRLQQVSSYGSGDETGISSGGAGGEVRICRQPTCFPGKSGLWVRRGACLGLEAGIKPKYALRLICSVLFCRCVCVCGCVHVLVPCWQSLEGTSDSLHLESQASVSHSVRVLRT